MLQQYVAPENTGDFERQIRPYVDKVGLVIALIINFYCFIFSLLACLVAMKKCREK
jgi:hypothetical protein